MADKQIDFPPLQKEVRWVAPFMWGLSLLCIVVVVVILLSDLDGPFIGPWGGSQVPFRRCRGSTSAARSAADSRQRD